MPQPNPSYARRYLLLGMLFGLLFPALASAILLVTGGGGPADLLALHRSRPLLWIIDTAPFWLGLFAYVAGQRQDQVVRLLAEREQTIAEQTSLLRAQAEELEVRAVEAEEVAQLKSTFLTTMSHELRTPLNAVIGLTELLLGEVDDDQRETVTLILEGGQHLLDTINSVLTYARIQAGRMELQLSPVAPHEVLARTLPLLETLAQRKRLALTYTCASPETRAYLDASAFGQVAINLIGNAIKFTDAGQVDVRLDAEAEHIRLQVADTGPGIAADQLPHIFHEFRQASAGLQRAHEGSGLGLAITSHLVHAMHGTIAVTSTEGAGCCFTVRLPRVLDASTPERRPSASEIASPEHS